MVDQLRPEDWEIPVAIPDLEDLERILVPFDGSHTAERAIAWAVRLAAGSSAELVLMVAYERPLTKKGRGSLYVDQMKAALSDEATELATEAIEQAQGLGASCRAVVVEGDPASAILATAEEEAVDLIVMGGRGLTSELGGFAGSIEKLRSALEGGVAHKVVRQATRAVLVVN